MALAIRRPAAATLLALAAALLFLLAGPAAATGKTGQVTVFWGRNKAEGSLREACDTGTYTFIVISFLNVSGHGTPRLDLSGHPTGGLGADIKYCQSKSIMLFLSVGDQYPLPSAQAATDLADYLWYAYLAGHRADVRRPFGDAELDGVDLFIDRGPADHYDLLARRLWSYNADFRGRVPAQMSVTAPCRYPPETGVAAALATGDITRINVRFYGDAYCAAYWRQEWEKWTAAYRDSSIVYFGLPASEQTVGYVSPRNLNGSVIPVVQEAANYAGIMIWERYADKQTKYSSYAIQWA